VNDTTTHDLQKVSDLGRKLGVVEIQLAVQGWALKHMRDISVEAMRELLQAVRLGPKELG
jgi:hypothetical protein